MRHRSRLIIAAAVLATATLPALSQVPDRPLLYRLEPTSTFKKGCFAPCMCPMQESSVLKGTFVLSLVSVGNMTDFYDVTGVHLKFQRSSGEVVTVTGSGTYAVSTVADTQRMDLTLVVGTDPPTQFHSGDVPGGAAFPRIAIAISINGIFCLDSVVDMKSRPARRFYAEPQDIHWDVATNGATTTTSDVVWGDLRTLRQTGGAFNTATWACAADANGDGWATFAGTPQPGQGIWFLERATGDVYADDDAAEVASPDPGIAAAPGRCP
jgi:hypothetical protein